MTNYIWVNKSQNVKSNDSMFHFLEIWWRGVIEIGTFSLMLVQYLRQALVIRVYEKHGEMSQRESNTY